MGEIIPKRTALTQASPEKFWTLSFYKKCHNKTETELAQKENIFSPWPPPQVNSSNQSTLIN